MRGQHYLDLNRPRPRRSWQDLRIPFQDELTDFVRPNKDTTCIASSAASSPSKAKFQLFICFYSSARFGYFKLSF